jgi:AmiR/NasT family two-component response regulator
LGAKELRTALLLADITVETLLDRQEVLVQRGDTDRLVLDAGNRAQLFQAQGMVMVRLGVSLAEAMIRMRAYAFAENRRLDDVAWDIVNHKLRLGPSHT